MLTRVNNKEKRFLAELIKCAKANSYKIDKPWRESQLTKQAKIADMSSRTVSELNTLIKIVSAYYGVSVEDIRNHSRKRCNVVPRQIFCHIAYTDLLATFTDIGYFLGGRDHTTTLYAVNTAVPSLEFNDPRVTEDIASIVELYKATFN